MVLSKSFGAPALLTFFLSTTLLILSAFGGGLISLFPDANAAPNPPNLNADFLDSIDSLQFLRSDTDDSYTFGTLTFDAGTTLAVAGDFTISDTNIAFTGGDTIFDLSNAFTSTLTIANSNGSNIANLSVEGDVSGNTLNSLVATGTAPLSVGSATKVVNLNADSLDDQTGSYYLDLDNETGTCADCLTGAEINESSLVGVDAAILEGQPGVYYLSRSNHVGTQASVTISDFAEASQDSVGGFLTDTSSIDLTYNDESDQITADVLTGGIDHGSLAGLGNDDHPQYLMTDGTRALSGNWNAGSFEVKSLTFQSNVAIGTAPFVVTSTTAVANLNSDLLDDETGSYYLDLDNEVGTCNNCFTGSEIDESTLAGVNADLFDSLNSDQFLLANGTRPLTADWDAGSFKITAKQLGLSSGSDTDTLFLSAEAPKILATSTDNASGLRLDVLGTASQLLRLQYNGDTKFSFWTTGVSELGTIKNSTFDTNVNLFKTPAFRATKSTTSGPYNNETQTVGTDIKEYDYGNNFLSFNFIAPFDGVYHFDGAVLLGSLNDVGTTNIVFLTVNGVQRVDGNRLVHGGGNSDAISLTISTDIFLNLGDAVRMKVSSTDSSFNIGGISSGRWSYFSGRMVVRNN